jgi:hypothetical protein
MAALNWAGARECEKVDLIASLTEESPDAIREDDTPFLAAYFTDSP